MNILVAKNGAQLGPFSDTDVRAKLSSGEFAPTDFGWHEGLTAWSPLSQLLGGAPAPSVTPTPVPYAAPTPQAQPYVAPQTINSPYPHPYQQGATPAWGGQGGAIYAGFWLRFVAYIIDAIILAIPTFVVIFAVALATGMDQQAATFLSRVFNVILGWLYYGYLESSNSQATWGKMILGLKVTDEGGNRINFGQATGRYFAMIVSLLTLCVGFMMAGFTQRKQGLHDILAHTLVVRKSA